VATLWAMSNKTRAQQVPPKEGKAVSGKELASLDLGAKLECVGPL
jgi:hypothetical protein